uniref:Non-haem dioxygenase N-terminal domain-containing protein n=3 Tax=Manihot esculenta TaxID=3983 RepID=A0A2C9UY62_MANES
MAFSSPHIMPENPIDFRAPPPSPIASGRRSSVANDDVLTEFLEHSLRVPDLVLPDKIFPRQKIVETPPSIDFQSLHSPGSDSIPRILDSLSRMGCFQLVNYGIPSDFTRMVLTMAAGIFKVPPKQRLTVTRSPEKPYGFEEVHGEEESELSEEFVWYRDEKLKLDMETIMEARYSNFSEKMEALVSDMENVAEKIMQIVRENSERKTMYGGDILQGQDLVGSVCYVCKHRNNRRANYLGYDVIKMLIRGTDYSHALCLHICDGSSEFHVYSKKGWVSFSPDKDALVVTAGDQIQVQIATYTCILNLNSPCFLSK